MATKTSRLQLVIAGDNKGAVKSIQGTEKALGGLQGKLGGLGAGLAGAFSVGAVVAFGKASVASYSQVAGNVAQIKRLTGDSAENASLLAFAAQQSGIDATKAAVGWRTLAKNIDNGKVAAEGIATSDGNGRLLTFDQILGNVADKIQALPPGFQRTALAQRLFGKSGADMVKVLANGRQGIEDLRSEMQSYGLEFDDAGLKKYQKFVAAQRDMKAAMTGLQVEVAEKVVPVLTHLNNLFADLPKPVKDAALVAGGLTAATLALATAVGVLGPSLERGLVTLRLRTAAEVGATAVTEADTVATLELAAAQGTATTAATGLITKLTLIESAGLAALAIVNKVKPNGVDEIFDRSLKANVKAIAQAKLTKAEVENVLDPSTVGKDNVAKLLAEIGKESPAALYRMRKALGDTYDPTSALGTAIANLRGNTKKQKGATDEATASFEKSKAAIQNLTTVQERANDAVQSSLDYHDQQRAVEDAAASASADRVQAIHDVADAIEAEAETEQSAAESIASAQQAVRDSSEQLTEAHRTATEAQADLNQERIDAKKRLEDLADAERDAALASADASLKAKEARNEARRVAADPRSTALEKERAALTVKQADEDARDAKVEATRAAQDNQLAQAKGVEGDAAVVDARKAVADADKGVKDAEDGLADARRNVAKTEKQAAKDIAQARADVSAAQDKAREATINDGIAFGNLQIALHGAKDGAQLFLDKMLEIYRTLDPSSPEGQKLLRLIEGLMGAVEVGRISSGGQVVVPTRDPDAGPRRPGRRRGGPVVKGREYIVGEDQPELFVPNESGTIVPQVPAAGGRGSVTFIQNFAGTPRQTARAQKAATFEALDQLARSTR